MYDFIAVRIHTVGDGDSAMTGAPIRKTTHVRPLNIDSLDTCLLRGGLRKTSSQNLWLECHTLIASDTCHSKDPKAVFVCLTPVLCTSYIHLSTDPIDQAAMLQQALDWDSISIDWAQRSFPA